MQSHYRSELNQTDPFKKLAQQYPSVYDENFTFCVPEQWIESLRSLSLAINTLLTNHPDISIDVSDVKEKHGELRFYYSLAGPKSPHIQLDLHIERLIAKANKQVQRLVNKMEWL